MKSPAAPPRHHQHDRRRRQVSPEERGAPPGRANQTDRGGSDRRRGGLVNTPSMRVRDLPSWSSRTLGGPGESSALPRQATSSSKHLTDQELAMSFANWSVSDNMAWTCGTCTFVNTNPRHLTCDVCGETKPENKPPQQQRLRNEGGGNESALGCIGEGGDDSSQDSANSGGGRTGSSRRRREEEDCTPFDDEHLTAIERERMREHVAMQRQIMEEIEREKEEYDTRMRDIASMQERVMAKLREAEAEESSRRHCGGGGRGRGRVQRSASNPAADYHYDGDYDRTFDMCRAGLLEQQRSLNESSRRVRVLLDAECRLVGESERHLRDHHDPTPEQHMSDEQLKALDKMRREWVEREMQLADMRRKMLRRSEVEEKKAKRMPM